MTQVTRRGRISRTFDELGAAGRTGLVTFITAGDPAPELTVSLMHSLVEGGADVIELGLPFSDPMADGPVVQRASERALAQGMTAAGALTLVREFRDSNGTTPVVLMGYVNPVERYGFERFARDAEQAGVDGLLLVDLPADLLDRVASALSESALDVIFLLAPTTPPERIRSVVAHASGFLYYVSVKGVTGSAQPAVEEVRERVASLKQWTDLPVGVGFGIRTPQQAAAFGAVADAVVVGSSLIEGLEEAMADNTNAAALAECLRGQVAALRQALDKQADSQAVAR